jgi:hypothetical protein
MLTQTLKILILFVMMLSGVANAIAEEFMYVYRCKVMVGDSLCYLVKQGHSRKNNNWEPFCGEFANFYFADGYSGIRQCPVYVKKYDINVDTMYVIKMIGCDDSGIMIRCDCDKFRKEYEKKKDVEKCDCPVIEESRIKIR